MNRLDNNPYTTRYEQSADLDAKSLAPSGPSNAATSSANLFSTQPTTDCKHEGSGTNIRTVTQLSSGISQLQLHTICIQTAEISSDDEGDSTEPYVSDGEEEYSKSPTLQRTKRATTADWEKISEQLGADYMDIQE